MQTEEDELRGKMKWTKPRRTRTTQPDGKSRDRGTEEYTGET